MKLLETINYISYSAVVLDEKSKEKILNRVEIPHNWKIINHHMTIKLGELPENLKNIIGEVVELRITKIGKSDKAIAFGVDTEISLNKIPHITVAINVENGGKPKDSNDIENWEYLDVPFTVKGRIEEIY